MAGSTNFPATLDDDSSLHDVTDTVTAIAAAHHNNMKEAIKAMQAKIGVTDTTVATALDYRVGHPTFGHRHDGASGQGPQISYNDLADVPTISGVFDIHPTYFVPPLARLRFASSYSGDIHAPVGTIIPTAWEKTFLYLNNGGDVGLAGWRYMEFGLNSYNPGGSREYTKFYFYGGWGMVLPLIATSAIHATYSEKGQVYFDEANNRLRVWTGATWRSVAFE